MCRVSFHTSSICLFSLSCDYLPSPISFTCVLLTVFLRSMCSPSLSVSPVYYFVCHCTSVIVFFACFLPVPLSYLLVLSVATFGCDPCLLQHPLSSVLTNLTCSVFRTCIRVHPHFLVLLGINCDNSLM